jgi:hypothetical protein
LTNQLKTVEPLEATFKYARAQKREDTPTAMLKSIFVSVDLEMEREDQKGGGIGKSTHYGTPQRLQALKIRGADPCTAKE